MACGCLSLRVIPRDERAVCGHGRVASIGTDNYSTDICISEVFRTDFASEIVTDFCA